MFAAFIDDEYDVSLTFLSQSLAIIQLAVIPTLLVIPYLNGFKCNYLCLFLQTVPMLCVIAQSLLPIYDKKGGAFAYLNIYVLAVIRTFVGQLFWTLSNSICFHFMLEPDGQKPWRKNTATTIYMGTWTYSTFLFLAVGPAIDHFGFTKAMLVAGIVNLVLGVVMAIRFDDLHLCSLNGPSRGCLSG